MICEMRDGVSVPMPLQMAGLCFTGHAHTEVPLAGFAAVHIWMVAIAPRLLHVVAQDCCGVCVVRSGACGDSPQVNT